MITSRNVRGQHHYMTFELHLSFRVPSFSLLWRGWRKVLEYSDLTDLNYVDKSRQLAPRFQRYLDQEMEKAG